MKMSNELRQMLKNMSEAPDTQIDSTITPRILEVETSEDMKQILDECAYASLASDSAMVFMDLVWKFLKEEGL